MKESKVVSQFSLEDIDLEDLFKQQGEVFFNEDTVITCLNTRKKEAR